MANRRHLKILEQGVEAWNKWRSENAEIKPNLRGANLKGRNLADADFSDADIRSTNFSGANLREAKFCKAKAGLKRRWAILLVLASWLLALISGFLSGYIGYFVSLIFSSELDDRVAGWVSLIVLIIFFFVTLRRGIIPALGFAAGAFAVAFAVAGAFAVAFAVAGAFAVAFAVAMTLLCGYMAWQALKGNEKYALIRNVAIAIAALGGTSFRGADLSDADFRGARLKSTDLRKAILNRTYWHNTEKLDRVRPGTSYLSNAEVRELVRTGQGQGKNFDHLEELRGINLKEANLTDASFIGSNLNRANLQRTNLSRASLVQTLLEGADLTGATLTGAYIQDWGISSTTKIERTNCDYVYLKLPTNEKPDPDRHPADTNTNFKPGEFASLVGVVTNTIDLVFENGIDWKAFLPTLQELQFKYQEENLSIAAIEKKPDGAFVVRLNVSPYADKGLIETQAKKLYEEKLKLIEAQHRAELKSLEAEYSIKLSNKTEEIIQVYKKHNSDILELGKLAASRPISAEAQAVINQSEDSSTKYDFSQAQITASGAGSFNLGKIKGTVANSINQLPDALDKDKPNIKELLKQLNEAIADSKELDDEDKAEALEQVKTLAEVGKNPTDEGSKKVAKTAMKILKGTAAMLPAGAALVTICKELLPAIAKFFGF